MAVTKAPQGVAVDGRTITITVPNLVAVGEDRKGIDEGEIVTVTFYSESGITKTDRPDTYQWDVEGVTSVGGVEVTDADAPDVGVGEPGVGTPRYPSFEADSRDPGKNTRYTLKFDLKKTTNTLLHDLVIELPDYGVPSSISTSAVTIKAGDYTFTPEDVSVDGEEIFISIGDVTENTGDG